MSAQAGGGEPYSFLLNAHNGVCTCPLCCPEKWALNTYVPQFGAYEKREEATTGCRPIVAVDEQRVREIIREELRAAGVLKETP